MGKNMTEIISKMQSHNINQIGIENFLYNYDQFKNRKFSLISAQDVKNPENIKKFSEIDKKYEVIGNSKLSQTVMIKLNGGLGTSMGLKKAKSLLKVKDGLSFLDIIVKQTEVMNIPLVLMNSINTQKDSLDLLKKYEKISDQQTSLDFIQNMVPKISIDSDLPVIYPKDENMEWCPPGHGDIYISILTSGVLDHLLD